MYSNRKKTVCMASLIFSFLFWCVGYAQQLSEEERQLKKEIITPKVVDFSRILEKEELTREDFELWKRQKELKLQERLSMVEALEQAIDPEKYIVGPGDIFSFNLWGPMEMKYPITVNPEGKLLVPSVGEIDVDGLSLQNTQKLVIGKSEPFYEKSKITLTLEALRFFRIHVVGEVLFPGTYVAQNIDRISELITEAGGVTEWAWKQRVELRHPDGTVEYFNLAAFEQDGQLEREYLINGGDVIFIPPIKLGNHLVTVEGERENSGTYQIIVGENLLDFLQRIRALKKNTDLTKIMVIRSQPEKDDQADGEMFFRPFLDLNTSAPIFKLVHGDRIVLPSNYVYVKGAVRISGAYPYILNMRARDYAGMAGGDYRSGNIKDVWVYHVLDGKTEKGPDVIVEPGDVVHLNPTWNQRISSYLQLIPAITSLILAAHAAGLFGN